MNGFHCLWWLQDGAPFYRRRAVVDRLTELFGERVIALSREVEWPPRSQDFTPLDFFLRGYSKSKVFQTPPESLEELKQRIRHEMNFLRQDRANGAMVRRAVFDIVRRVKVCRKSWRTCRRLRCSYFLMRKVHILSFVCIFLFL